MQIGAENCVKKMRIWPEITEVMEITKNCAEMMQSGSNLERGQIDAKQNEIKRAGSHHNIVS